MTKLKRAGGAEPAAQPRAHTRGPLAKILNDAARAVASVRAGRSLGVALPRSRLEPAVQDLCYGTLRDFGRGDFFLRRLLNKPLGEPQVHALLLVALHRLETRPGEAHTTVDQAVDAAHAVAGGRLRGLVNGVLRTFLRRREDLVAAAQADDTARWRHPPWWLERLRADHPSHWSEIAAAGNGHPPMALRVNRQGTTREAYLNLLAEAGLAARPVGEEGILLERPVPVQVLPGFADGVVSVQDAGAQRAAHLLDARSGMRVLDACAAPGGKTSHLLELADIELTALDESAVRTAMIAENLDRLGLVARVIAADCRDTRLWWDGRYFDRILADVPCSASGVVRRHPDAKWLRRAGDIARFAAVQGAILDALWRVLAADGKLLYATCSVFAEENQAQIAAFAARTPDCRRLLIDDAMDCQILPDTEHDGFYYALLEKRI